MEYSRPYSVFAGVMEMVVVVLLCFRRTTTLGALLCLPVLANVALMNLCYGVPVKLFSLMTVASAAVLVLYDARRLVNLLVLHRPVAPETLAPPFRTRRWNQLRWVVKLVVVGGVIVSSMVEMDDTGAEAGQTALYGAWKVTSLSVAGATPVASARWRRIVITRHTVLLRLDDDSLVRCSPTLDEAARTLALDCANARHTGSLRWVRNGDDAQLSGTFDNTALEATIKHVNEAEFPLLRARFRWIVDG